MKLIDITSENITKISNQELVSLHRRIHQLYGVARKRNSNHKVIQKLVRYHSVIVREMKRRNLLHKSQIKFKMPGDI
jgi:hypothetical protein